MTVWMLHGLAGLLITLSITRNYMSHLKGMHTLIAQLFLSTHPCSMGMVGTIITRDYVPVINSFEMSGAWTYTYMIHS